MFLRPGSLSTQQLFMASHGSLTSRAATNVRRWDQNVIDVKVFNSEKHISRQGSEEEKPL